MDFLESTVPLVVVCRGSFQALKPQGASDYSVDDNISMQSSHEILAPAPAQFADSSPEEINKVIKRHSDDVDDHIFL